MSQIGGGSADVRIAGVDAVPVQAALRRVSAGYNGLLDIALLAGRDFDGNDRSGAEPVAIVNRTLARRLFGDTSPLDRSIDLPLGRSGRSVCRIVGVVADVHNDRLRAAALPEVLVPFAQAPRVAMTFLLRSDPALPGIDTAMANALWSVDPRQTITAQYTLQQRIDDELRPLRFFARVVTGFAFAALVLAVFGVYAVAALQQRRRIAEFGLRLAVGATPSRLARGILGASLIVSSLGVGAGCAIAAVALRWFDPSRLAGAIPLLPVFVGGTAAMMLAALLAAALPAWRVLRVTPLEALRDE
ncbi:MAG: ABC transporter permease [Dokdonella sp.]|nr:ABC transporter permease [Dokdonella sp.]